MNKRLLKLSLILIVTEVVRRDYRRFIKERNETQKKFSSLDTAYGKVEYLDLGAKDDSVVLLSAGGGVGIDFALSFYWLIKKGYRIIAVNRPGYYSLPVDAVDSIKGHSDIYHEVITKLGIKEVSVFGISMGGLAALHYAQHYPVKSMVLWSAVTGSYQPNQESVDSALGKLVMTRKGKNIISWVMVRTSQIYPKAMVRSLLQTEASLNDKEVNDISQFILNNINEKRRFVQLIKSMTPMTKLYNGMIDEVEKSANSQSFDWLKINTPTFAVHSTADKDVGYEHFKRLQMHLINGKFLSVKAGGHFVWWGTEGEYVLRETGTFLDRQYRE